MAKTSGECDRETAPVDETVPPGSPSGSEAPADGALAMLPYDGQYLLLCCIQAVVERCTFRYVQQHAPAIVATRGWSCFQAVTMTDWLHAVPAMWDQCVPLSSTFDSQIHLQEIFQHLGSVEAAIQQRRALSLADLHYAFGVATTLLGRLGDEDDRLALQALERSLVEELEGTSRRLVDADKAWAEEMAELERQRQRLEQTAQEARTRHERDVQATRAVSRRHLTRAASQVWCRVEAELD